MPISTASFHDRLTRIETGTGRADGGAAKAHVSQKLGRVTRRLTGAAMTALCLGIVGKAGLILLLGDGVYTGHVARIAAMAPEPAGAMVSLVLGVDPLTGWMADTAGGFARQVV